MLSLTKPPNCPDCGSSSVHRSRRKGFGEHILHTVFFISPFRCRACDSRYFRFRFGNHSAAKPPPPAPYPTFLTIQSKSRRRSGGGDPACPEPPSRQAFPLLSSRLAS